MAFTIIKRPIPPRKSSIARLDLRRPQTYATIETVNKFPVVITMAFRLIDVEKWDRKEYYLHFMREVVCTYSVNVEIDVTPLREQRLYPAMLWLLTDTVNDYEQFRTHLSPNGPGIFDRMLPSYTIFNKIRETFSSIWTEFSPDYGEFLRRYTADTKAYENASAFSPKPGKPENCFDVSMLPWLTFTAFNINVYDTGNYLLPIFTMGKSFERNEKLLLPLSIQVHHAVCDGYHVSKFVNTLQEKAASFSFRPNGK